MGLFSKSKSDLPITALPLRKPPAIPAGDVMEGAIIPGFERPHTAPAAPVKKTAAAEQ